jgi:hypothetical protein
VAFDRDLFKAGDRAETLNWRWSREHDFDAMCAHAGEVVELSDGREMALTHDADTIAEMLDLGEDVR